MEWETLAGLVLMLGTVIVSGGMIGFRASGNNNRYDDNFFMIIVSFTLWLYYIGALLFEPFALSRNSSIIGYVMAVTLTGALVELFSGLLCYCFFKWFNGWVKRYVETIR